MPGIAEISERPDAEIGPYRLLQVIGEGGFGVVYMAGPMSEILPEPPYANEPAPACLLTDVFEWHVFCALQQPGHPNGRIPGQNDRMVAAAPQTLRLLRTDAA